MNRMGESEDRDRLRSTAADWAVRLDAADCPDADRLAFLDWLDADPAHLPAYQRACAVWVELDGLRTLEALPVAVSAAPAASGRVPASRVAASGWRRRPHRVWRVAAALLLGLGAGLLLREEATLRLSADLRTAVGETASMTLEDGSRIQLNTDSAVRLRYGPGVREVELLAGEAAFEVTRDAQRPFRVRAADGTATVLGTVFTVRHRDAGAQVVVMEGRVRVQTGAGQTELGQGQQVVYRDGALSPVEHVDAHAASAWRRGHINFVNRPLGEVVAELDRYHPGRIILRDAALAAQPVSGVFDTQRPLDAIEVLERTLDLHTRRYTPYLIVLGR